MSIEYCFFAEQKDGERWQILGDLSKPSYPDAPPRPWEPVEVGEFDELITVLSGRFPRSVGFHHSGLTVLSKPRGLPDDLSKELADWARYEDDVVCSPSWLLASEILGLDWDEPNILFTAYAYPERARLFDADDPAAPFPAREWPEGRYEVCSHPFQLERLESAGTNLRELLYLWRPSGAQEVFWAESHREYLGESLDDFLDALATLGSPERVRLVFWTIA